MALITQRNSAELHYFAENFVWIIGIIGVRLRLSARSARDIGVSLVITGVLLREYSPADSADHAEEYSKLYYFAEKDMLELVCFGVRLR
ncbi:hypothetical protein, partial [Segatella paludivivens]|uniref:hypothetical protein n=1 Tax=Segatella paludivivens TaxID=185294 RepID=UPI001EE324CA